MSRSKNRGREGEGRMMERRSAFCRPVVVRLHALFHRPPPPPPPPSPLDSHNSVGSLGRRERERERICVCGRAKACINTRGEARITSYGR